MMIKDLGHGDEDGPGQTFMTILFAGIERENGWSGKIDSPPGSPFYPHSRMQNRARRNQYVQ